MVPVTSNGNLTDGTLLDWAQCTSENTTARTQQLWVVIDDGQSGWVQSVYDPKYCLDAGSGEI